MVQAALPFPLYFLGDRGGVFQFRRSVAWYDAAAIVARAAPQVPDAEIVLSSGAVRVVTDKSNYHYQLAFPLALSRDAVYAVRVAVRVESGGAMVGVEDGERWVVPPVRVRTPACVGTYDLGAFTHTGRTPRLIVANGVDQAPDRSTIVLNSIELWELEPFSFGRVETSR